jgi:dimethylhistidine N-methyltransferase
MILLNSTTRSTQQFPTQPATQRSIPFEQQPAFLMDVIEGLGKRQKEIPCKYFYDERGSMLFTEICQTAEYYITRTELQLFGKVLPDISTRIGPQATVIEYGSGEGRKIRDLLRSLQSPHAYVPIDISAEILFNAARRLKREFPSLDIYPMVADYTAQIALPEEVSKRGGKRVAFFPGSTISNFTPPEAAQFLRNMRQFLQRGDAFILGVDLIKSPNRLHQAYNDYDGVTAEFNLNLLRRINRELDGNFKIHQFEHYAFFNPRYSRIEMHLVSLTDQTVKIGRHSFSFRAGETIHTENSYKYSIDRVTQLGQEAGFQHEQVWTDEGNLFGVHYLTAI